jgi:hypothetical protein
MISTGIGSIRSRDIEREAPIHTEYSAYVPAANLFFNPIAVEEAASRRTEVDRCRLA